MRRGPYKATPAVCEAVMQHHTELVRLGTVQDAIRERQRKRAALGGTKRAAARLGISQTMYYYIVKQGGKLKASQSAHELLGLRAPAVD